MWEKLSQYIQNHESVFRTYGQPMAREELLSDLPRLASSEMDQYIEKKRKKEFRDMLYALIDQRGLEDVEVYKRALLDRRHFSKIRSGNGYRPGKNTVVALCLALHLDLEKTEALLETLGYALSESDLGDLIIRFCIEHEMYNIHDVNLALDRYDQKPLAVGSG